MADLLSLNVRAVSGRVLLIVNGEPVGVLAWQAAKDAAIELKRLAQTSADPSIGYVLQTGARPIGLDLEREAALKVSAALHQAGAMAEEQADPQRVADDAALLIRLGSPFGLTNDPRIQDEAWKSAQWDSEFRRVPLRGVPSREKVGTPALLQSKPPRKLQ